MADFKTHITVSTAIGVAYGGVAYTCFQPYFQFDYPATTCLLAGTLCSVSGMLPDLDSDSGVPLRESLTFASACIPMLLLDRFQHYGWPPETIAMVGAAIYGAVRFGLGWLLKKYTVHRGMFHSIPAAIIAGEVAFLLCSHGNPYVRGYKAMAVVIGFMSHLVLDEIWSVKVQGGRIGLKSSSGTAVKLWGSSLWANISTYAKLALLTVLVLKDPMWMDISPELAKAHQLAAGVLPNQSPQQIVKQGERLVDGTLARVAGGVPVTTPPETQAGATRPPAKAYVPQGTYVPEGTHAPQTPYNQGPSIPRYGTPTIGAPGYGAPNYGAPGYGAPPHYSQPGYPQPGYPQPANPQQGYPPNVPGYPIPMGVGPGISQPRY
jgi:hypothetical protein